MRHCLHFIPVTQKLFTRYLCIFLFQKQLTKDFLLLCAPPTFKPVAGVQRVKTTEAKAKRPRPSFPAACTLGCIFISRVLTAVISQCAATCPLLFRPSVCPAPSLLSTAFTPWCGGDAGGGAGSSTYYTGANFCHLVPHLLQNREFWKGTKVA